MAAQVRSATAADPARQEWCGYPDPVNRPLPPARSRGPMAAEAGEKISSERRG
ncbi:hypothetical protein AB0L57_22770 [Nocardia sp. NPDC052254]|uniref:hypothetical protein n=1 Tax=Nocardia sp. NPDC052254 TaxID=3155681 RepID=UPI003420FF20